MPTFLKSAMAQYFFMWPVRSSFCLILVTVGWVVLIFWAMCLSGILPSFRSSNRTCFSLFFSVWGIVSLSPE